METLKKPQRPNVFCLNPAFHHYHTAVTVTIKLAAKAWDVKLQKLISSPSAHSSVTIPFILLKYSDYIAQTQSSKTLFHISV
jgi:hypothetical protein